MNCYSGSRFTGAQKPPARRASSAHVDSTSGPVADAAHVAAPAPGASQRKRDAPLVSSQLVGARYDNFPTIVSSQFLENSRDNYLRSAPVPGGRPSRTAIHARLAE